VKTKYIAIINGGGANFNSVINALKILKVKTVITDDAKIISNAEKVILPGVGSADYAMKLLKQKGLDVVIKNLKQPVLGICLGAQLLCKSSAEGHVKCLDIIPLKVEKITNAKIIPHMG
jgi:glutamine amidotransferase